MLSGKGLPRCRIGNPTLSLARVAGHALGLARPSIDLRTMPKQKEMSKRTRREQDSNLRSRRNEISNLTQ